jgi:anti-sigma factor RsiW
MESEALTELEDMSCRELVEAITAYLEGTLAREDRTRCQAHLEECHWCRNYVAQMRDTIRALGSLDRESLAPQTRNELLYAYRSWRVGE